jgi:cytochrome P450
MSVLRDSRMSCARPAQAVVAVPDEQRTEFASFIEHAQRWLLFLDAPAHTRLRKLMNRGFAPLTVEKLRPRVVAAVDELLRKAEAASQFDVIADFAYPLPVRIISELLGVPPSLYDRCIVLSTAIANWLGNLRRTAQDARGASEAVKELVGYFADVIRERQGAQHEDLLHLLLSIAATEPDITVEDVYAQCVLLLVAGHETTRNLLGNGIYTLLTHPEELSEVSARQEVVPAVVEEVLRFECPVQAFGRYTATELEIDGVPLPAGASITLASAPRTVTRSISRTPSASTSSVNVTGTWPSAGMRMFVSGAPWRAWRARWASRHWSSAFRACAWPSPLPTGGPISPSGDCARCA